jgi:DHA1 family tetracycline resistance protein-like MFS transporter
LSQGVNPATPRRAALAFILITIMLDMLAMSLVIPVLPRLVLGFMHSNTASASRSSSFPISALASIIS